MHHDVGARKRNGRMLTDLGLLGSVPRFPRVATAAAAAATTATMSVSATTPPPISASTPAAAPWTPGLG